MAGSVVTEVEAIAAAAGCDDGEWVMEFRFQEGVLLKAYLHHGPIKNDELVALAVAARASDAP